MRVDLTVALKVKQKMKSPTNILQLVIKWLFIPSWEHWDRQFWWERHDYFWLHYTIPLQRSDTRFQWKNSYNKYVKYISCNHHKYPQLQWNWVTYHEKLHRGCPFERLFLYFIYAIDIRVFRAETFKRKIYWKEKKCPCMRLLKMRLILFYCVLKYQNLLHTVYHNGLINLVSGEVWGRTIYLLPLLLWLWNDGLLQMICEMGEPCQIIPFCI